MAIRGILAVESRIRVSSVGCESEIANIVDQEICSGFGPKTFCPCGTSL
jgi:hypothetical protein